MLISVGPALAATVGVQVLAVGAAWVLRRQERLLLRWLSYLVAIAVGVLLATALLHLLPESVERLGNRMPVYLLMGGSILVLFAMERVLYAVTGMSVEQPGAPALLREHEAREHGGLDDSAQDGLHHHHPGKARCAAKATGRGGGHARPANLLLASMLHSTVDGATIAAAFAAGERTGWLTALAVALHEVPHRMGDFALLVQLRVPLGRALRFAVLAGLPALLGAGVVLLLGAAEQHAVLWLLPISAGSFLYIALVNLLPELQVECRGWRVAAQLACVGLGVALVLVVAGMPQG